VAPIVKFSLDEIRRIHSAEDAIGADELATAQGALALGAWQTSLDGARAASATFAVEAVRWKDAEQVRTWPHALNAVTAHEVKQIAARYLDPARMHTVIVGPIDAIRQAHHPRWPVDLDSLKPEVRSAASR
jgi:predicted Zn-dependent peptidase